MIWLLLSKTPNTADLILIGFYFAATILVGWLLHKKTRTSFQFLHAGHNLPTAVTSLAFVAANCGALEVVGAISASAKYGATILHFYWIGAVPAMVFLGLYMMPIYLQSRAHTIPEFLKLRFSESTRILNVICSTIAMVLVSGISLYTFSQVLRVFLGWSFTRTTIIAAAVVLIYVYLGGLSATMYNSVLQFALIIGGMTPLAYFILHDFHGLHGLMSALPVGMRHPWAGLPFVDPKGHPMDVLGITMGLGFVLSCGYWCTDFVLIQRVLAARTVGGAMLTPVIGAIVKIVFPMLIVVPGLAAFLLFRPQLVANYDLALPMLMMHYYGHGLLGIGITAILASLMTGLSGNVTALSAIWVHDIYRARLAPDRSDRHYVFAGRLATLLVILLSILTAYIALLFNNLMDYLQLLFSIFNAPLFATFLLGMFTTWATPKAGFYGLLTGTIASIAHNAAYRSHLLVYGSDMAANFYGAILAWTSCFVVTVVMSTCTAAKPREELAGLTYWTTGREHIRIPRSAAILSMIALIVMIALNLLFR